MKYPLINRKPTKFLPIFGLTLFLVSLLTSQSTLAQVDEEELRQLRAQIAALSSRLERLEQSNTDMAEVIGNTQSLSRGSAWADRVSISGDLRPRYEHFDVENTASDRNRSRIRARLNISAAVNRDWDVSFGLASGGSDPISTNQTLGGGGTTKDFRLDYAYFDYRGIDKLLVTGGKYKSVFFKPGGQNMIFDGDYRPEGVGIKYETNNLFFNVAIMILESDDKHSSQDAENMWGAQLGYEMALNNAASLTFGVSYYEAAIAGSQPFYNGNPYGNSVDASGAFIYDYQEVELFAEANFTLRNQPLRLFGDYVKNLDADDYDTGWVIGGKYGNVSGAGSWEFGYSYQYLEADAVYGALTDSDYGGGGTDNKGHILKAAYGVGRNTEFGFTYFINEIGEASFGQTIDYKRLQVNLVTSF